jgi:manganese oxidase
MHTPTPRSPPVRARTLPAAIFFLLLSMPASAAVLGLEGSTFVLYAREGRVTTGEGNSLLLWGFADGAGGLAQYPGPTLILRQGDLVTVELHNDLPFPVSITFPGQLVTETGGVPGLLAAEAGPGGTVTYQFTASHAGTYLYRSGTRPELQVEMGLLGAMVVRPSDFQPAAPRAYGHADATYDREYLFLLTEMDPRIHERVEQRGVASLAQTDFLTDYFPNYWFLNGRTAPDTMAEANAPWLPSQPYNCMPRMHPGERVLMRVVNAGREVHPFHHHGNHARLIARDGRLLGSAPGSGANVGPQVFTIQSTPGGTIDAVFEWTGRGLGWDIYGHLFGDALAAGEDPADHGRPLPVALPQAQDLTFGGFYSGSPFLGTLGMLPPGEGGLNPSAGFVFMWHSHTEREIVNYNIFPGGMMTMMIVEAPGVPID